MGLIGNTATGVRGIVCDECGKSTTRAVLTNRLYRNPKSGELNRVLLCVACAQKMRGGKR